MERIAKYCNDLFLVFGSNLWFWQVLPHLPLDIWWFLFLIFKKIPGVSYPLSRSILILCGIVNTK